MSRAADRPQTSPHQTSYVAAKLRRKKNPAFYHCGRAFARGHKSKERSPNHAPKPRKHKLSLDFHMFSLNFIVFSLVCWFWKSWEGEWARASVPQICKMHRKFSETAATPSTNLKVGVQSQMPGCGPSAVSRASYRLTVLCEVSLAPSSSRYDAYTQI